MPAQETLVSVEEYMNTGYDPDCEYIDARIVERHSGEKDHSKPQRSAGREELDDYRDLDLPFAWLSDPRRRRGYTCNLAEGVEVTREGLRTQNPDIELPIERLFE